MVYTTLPVLLFSHSSSGALCPFSPINISFTLENQSICDTDFEEVILREQSDIDAIAHCTYIYGSLSIELYGKDYPGNNSVPPVVFNLPAGLTHVGAFSLITYGHAATTTLNAPGLVSIGTYENSTGGLTINGDLSEQADSILTSISFPNLQTLGSDFEYWVSPNTSLVTGFPYLEIIAGSLYIYGNITSVDLPSLTSVYDIVIVSNSTEFECPENLVQIYDGEANSESIICHGKGGANPVIESPTTSPSTPTATAASPLLVPLTNGLNQTIYFANSSLSIITFC